MWIDFVYLVCEPPGEPYYIARVMEFIHKNNDPVQPVEMVRVNWMYRPRDLNRKTYEPRLLFASMHADSSPLLSLRGKCRVVHAARIKDLDGFLRQKDSFFFEQLYDRYMHRYFDVIPHELVRNIAPQYKKVIDEQWEFIIAENSKAKELTGASKTCKICGEYCPK
jgi:BAH domain